jgi:CHAD domain-containing protein
MTTHATTPIAAVLADALVRQHRALLRRVPAALSGRVSAVHRARVSSRRLREVLAVVAARLGRDAARVRRDVRRLTRALGPVREIDVALGELDRTARREDWPPETISAIRRRLERELERRRATLAQRAARYPRASLGDRCRSLAETLARDGTEATWWTALAAHVVRRADRVRSTAAACGTLYGPDRLHALRIAVKKLRYAVELVPATPGFDRKDALALLKRAQTRFGRLHDVQVLLAEVHAMGDASRLTGGRQALEGVAETLERDCRHIHASTLPVIPEVHACAREISREIGLRRRRRGLAMAKAHVHGAKPHAVGRSKAVGVSH